MPTTTNLSTTVHQVPTAHGPVPVTVTERGQGRPVLLLHGGAGPDSVAGFADLLAARGPARVLTPTHPGFAGTPRPDGIDSVRRLAEVYRGLLDLLDLTDVTVVGNSIGGWIAVELALAAPGRVGRLVLLNAVGPTSAEHPVADFFALTLDEVVNLSYADPDRFRINLAALTEAQKSVAAGNRRTLQTYGGPAMADPGLAGRLGGLAVPTLVVWGDADRMAVPTYGRQYAAAIPGAAFHPLPGAGHLPHLEAPEALLTLLVQFVPFAGGATADGE
ncbi:alpha/beta hydrolase [Frankia sp. AiPs1]|uniref:alpha/beta fold hydrolase n=1 Tax=Frankia sp. AiPs1 TaxID=573493 RepID=UPI00204482A6|nr:alpha/beta hydrolase [Frankia sp. AiPs1]MCM3921749.1 alpha/beta hydrolase [Frankia sp. AiPs1]